MSLWHDIAKADSREGDDGKIKTFRERNIVKVAHNGWHYRDSEEHKDCNENQRRCRRKGGAAIQEIMLRKQPNIYVI